MKVLILIICVFFIILWIYSSVPKLISLKKFREALHSQAIPKWMASILSWALPVSELFIVGLLFFHQTRLWGLFASFVLMTLYTLYVAGIIFKVYKTYPCPCGGIFREIGWDKHFKVNLVFTLMALTGIVLMYL